MRDELILPLKQSLTVQNKDAKKSSWPASKHSSFSLFQAPAKI